MTGCHSLKQDRWKYAVLKSIFDEGSGQAQRMLSDGRSDLRRVFEELRALLGTSLSSIALISRFKERCTWFDKDGMRRLAAGEGDAKGVREDRLTMALARYLHDNGVFSLVRSRMANLEPDVIAPFGPRRMAIESKVHGKGESAKGSRSPWILAASRLPDCVGNEDPPCPRRLPRRLPPRWRHLRRARRRRLESVRR